MLFLTGHELTFPLLGTPSAFASSENRWISLDENIAVAAVASVLASMTEKTTTKNETRDLLLISIFKKLKGKKWCTEWDRERERFEGIWGFYEFIKMEIVTVYYSAALKRQDWWSFQGKNNMVERRQDRWGKSVSLRWCHVGGPSSFLDLYVSEKTTCFDWRGRFLWHVGSISPSSNDYYTLDSRHKPKSICLFTNNGLIFTQTTPKHLRNTALRTTFFLWNNVTANYQIGP